MGFNDLMHPRNIYKKSPPDFKLLAEKFDYFRKLAKETKPGRFTLNFKDPESLRALTCALLEHDFGLKISIPLDRLIPTVPLRLNYILWLEDLLSYLPEDRNHSTVRGFDIGIVTWKTLIWACNCSVSINMNEALVVLLESCFSDGSRSLALNYFLSLSHVLCLRACS